MNNPLSRLPVVGKWFREPVAGRVYHGIDSIRRRASLFHYPLRAFFRAVARTQHSEIQAIGLENIPPDGAVFLVGNHPNSYVDFLNLSVVLRHPVATAAKDTITKTPLVGGFLRDYALLVPVSRVQDKEETGATEEERAAANEEMVREVVELLVRGRLFNIYAEGRSTDARRLNKIKLGFMMLAIQAEKAYDFKLNLRIVPYGYFYDRINKFQSSVCIIFGRPFKLRSLVELPANFLSLSAKEQLVYEKKLMLAGKEKLQSEIEKLIISIHDPKLVYLIDGITAVYVLSPVKYMGPFENVREKYALCKMISETIQIAAKSEEGAVRVETLNLLLKDYQTSLAEARVADALVRREYTWTSLGYHLKGLVMGILYAPLSFYGYLANVPSRQAARFMRYYVIEVKKRPMVDGDEQSILAAAAAGAIAYPIYYIVAYYLFRHFVMPWMNGFLSISTHLKDLAFLPAEHPVFLSILGATGAVYLMARLWRFSLFHGRRFRQGVRFLLDAISEIFLRSKLQKLREKRSELIDAMDFLIGDYYH